MMSTPLFRRSTQLLALAVAAVGARAETLHPPVERELTSATGETFAARILALTDTQVTATRLTDGVVFVFPVERLSHADRGFVEGLLAARKLRGQAPATRAADAGGTAAPTNPVVGNPASVARPSFSRALSQLGREKDPETLRTALEVVIGEWPSQSLRTFPAHHLSYSVWSATRRMPDRAAAEKWVDELLAPKLNDVLLSTEQLDGYLLVSLGRRATSLADAEWGRALDEFARRRPDSSLRPNLEKAYAGALYRTRPDEAKHRMERARAEPYPELAEVAQATLAEWTEWGALGPIETWRFTAIDGREVDIGKMRGKVVLVDFWATWCGPCVKEFPALRKLYADHREQGLEIVGIALEFDRPDAETSLANLRRYVVEKELPWPHYADANGWKTRYAAARGIGSIPRMVLIDREGKVVSDRLRGAALAEKVAALLASDAPKR